VGAFFSNKPDFEPWLQKSHEARRVVCIGEPHVFCIALAFGNFSSSSVAGCARRKQLRRLRLRRGNGKPSLISSSC
jgi:hypothetical protein